jgi:hypothetical protein
MLVLAAVLAFPACSREQPVAAERPVAAVAAPAARLPLLERERLDYLFEAATRVQRTWPRLAADEVCILLVAQAEQWVVNCLQAPAGFTPTPDQFRGRPIFAHSGDSFEGAGRTRTTRELLSDTPAAAHVFGPNAGEQQLPGQYPWLLLGTLEALRAFHPAFLPATTEHWLSVAMHELVHIHQLREPAFAQYSERIAAGTLQPAGLTTAYARDADLRAQIELEYQQLTAAAALAPSAESGGRALRSWLRSYRRRSARLLRQPGGAQLVQAEQLFTYLEGVARFVESDFLVNAEQYPPAGLERDPQFRRFAAFLGGGYAVSPNRQLDPQFYYAIGYHLCVLLERVDPDWKRRVDTEPGWLIGLVERLERPPLSAAGRHDSCCLE